MNPARGGWLVPLTLLGAMLLAVAHLPDGLPDWLRWLRPDWALALFFFWAVTAPERVGVVGAWCAGLLFDALLNQPLGLNGLGFALVAFFAGRAQARFVLYTVAQRAVVVGVAVVAVQLLEALLLAAFRGDPVMWQALLRALATMLVYPLLEWLLRPIVFRFVVP